MREDAEELSEEEAEEVSDDDLVVVSAAAAAAHSGPLTLSQYCSLYETVEIPMGTHLAHGKVVYLNLLQPLKVFFIPMLKSHKWTLQAHERLEGCH